MVKEKIVNMYNIDVVFRIKIWGFLIRMGEGYIFEFFVLIIKCLLYFLNSKWSLRLKLFLFDLILYVGFVVMC